MADLSHHNPVGRFKGLAEIYAKHRPSYPTTAIDFIVEQCRLGPESLLVDVGCGTGISTRLFAARGVQVVGIEPNDDMRGQAEAEAPVAGGLIPRYGKGSAEATGLPDGSATAVLAAQAFHWFDAARALQEFHRILQHDGHVALMWNERASTDPFTAAYGAVIRATPEAAAVEVLRGQAGRALLTSPLFTNAVQIEFANSQETDEEGLLGRAFSASYAPREPEPAAAFATELRRVFQRFETSGKVVIRYVTTVYLARRN